MISNTEYEKILREGKKVEWYGEMVPEDLITTVVKQWSDSVVRELNKLESTVSELRGKDREKKEKYIKKLWNNIKDAPFTLNGDVYMVKKKRIEEELSKKEGKKTKKRTTKRGKVTSSKTKTTKNSDLIFKNK